MDEDKRRITMNDYISREAVINITAETGAWETQNRVKDLPSADVQPMKHGRWINKGFITIYCSNCSKIPGGWPAPAPTDYCPNCGAKMDGDSE